MLAAWARADFYVFKGTSHTSKYVFGVFTYFSYRFHTHMNNRGA